jgi:hypothetical protein
MKDPTMKRLAALILATLALGSPVMARDNNYQSVQPPTGGPKSEFEALLNSERSRELDQIVEFTLKGDKKAAEEAYESYRKKYNTPPMGSSPGSEGASRPRESAPSYGRPKVLPPELR